MVHVDEDVADFDADDDLNHQNKSTGTAPLDKLHHGQHCLYSVWILRASL